MPSWLFDVKDSAAPLAVVAVQKQFLIPPVEPLSSPGVPGSARSAPSRVPFGFDAAKAGAAPDQLVLGYSDSSSCPHAHITPLVKESTDTVYVQLEADARPTGLACTTNAVAKTVAVPLQFPLAGRKVFDLTGDKTPLTVLTLTARGWGTSGRW